MNKFGPQRNNLSSIIRGYKGKVTRIIHESGNEYFSWQSRFHDHIIRNDKSLNIIRKYIHTNPKNWDNNVNKIKIQNNTLKKETYK